MTTQPVHDGGALIPRPEKTFPALRAALAQVAPSRLPEMTSERDTVFTMATQSNSFGPIAMFQLKWATVIEIERFPDVARRLRAAERAAQVLDKEDPKWQAAMDEIREIMQAARAKVANG
ncbi:hypothetical protein [Streptomyces iranensis]|uniref:Uncharacterized protein n=1 Tax=Streptomyces iranensis TaxID=576784 RepID=A0A060ZM47_9ACTN|nr:hypothetical protein [Streptomyces iranensis]MBP2067127.1 hypothetical protein [Streptomyces iranensis]CDR07252.1 predicted protein [Streptomyces iranensis]